MAQCSNEPNAVCQREATSLKVALERFKWDIVSSMLVGLTLQTVLLVEILWLFMPQGR